MSIFHSFKQERGARYTLLMLTPEQQKKGVIAASAGNHALALSYHGQDLGIPVTVVSDTWILALILWFASYPFPGLFVWRDRSPTLFSLVHI